MASESSDNTILTFTGITDAAGNVWTLVNSATNGVQIARNGKVDSSTSNVSRLVYANHQLYQTNTSGGWWVWKNNGWAGATAPLSIPPPPTPPTPTPPTPTPPTPPAPPPPSAKPSADNSQLNGTNGVLRDSALVEWTLVTSASSGLQVARAGVVDSTTANVTLLVYSGGLIYQQNNAGGWWVWQSSAWQNASAPATTTPTPPPTPTPTAGGTGPAASGSLLTVACGSPKGQTLYATLFGSSMASDVDFTPWGNGTLQNAAKTTAGFGLPGMYARINTNDTMMDGNGNPNMTYVDRISTAIPKIIDPATGTWSLNIGGNGMTNPGAFATGAAAIAKRFITNGVPCKAYEIFNENDGLDINTYCSIFNAAAQALHAIDPAIQLIGTNDSWMNGGRMSALAKQCGANVARFHYHSYSVDASYNDNAAMTQAINRFSGDASNLRSSIQGTACARTPAGVGEYNMDGNPPGDPRSAGIKGAVFNLLGLYSAFQADPLTTHGAVWDWLGDGYYGLIIDPGNNPSNQPAYTVVPTGYALKNCRQYMAGNVVATSLGASGNLKCLATTSGNRVSVLLINYDTNANFSGSIGLSNWPVNANGNGNLICTQVSPANPVTASSTVAVTGGVSASISVPAMSVTVLSST